MAQVTEAGFVLSGFGDEIAADLDEQLAAMQADGVPGLELRGAWGKNVADFSDADVQRIAETLPRYGMHVSDIGSPIGKTLITEPFQRELERFKRILEIALRLHSPFIRLFSFYMPDEPDKHRTYRDEIMHRLSTFAELAKDRPVTLVHENEKEIYGDTAERCLDVIQSVGRDNFKVSFDPANFVQCGVKPFSEAYSLLEPYIVHMQIKDAFFADGRVVVAGAGEGDVEAVLAALYRKGYHGYAALEPHLSASGQYGGFSGPQLFHEAVVALKGIITRVETTHGA